MDIALLAFLIMFNGVFAMSEIALVTARKSRLQRLADLFSFLPFSFLILPLVISKYISYYNSSNSCLKREK